MPCRAIEFAIDNYTIIDWRSAPKEEGAHSILVAGERERERLRNARKGVAAHLAEAIGLNC